MVANDRAVDAMNNGVEFTERAAPSTPVTNRIHLYAKDDGGVTKLFTKNNDGVEAALGNTDYKARAYRTTSTQSVSSATSTKILLNAESYDPSSSFDAVTNNRFVAPVTGYYSVNLSLQVNIEDQKVLQLMLFKNGAELTRSNIISSGTNDFIPNLSDIVFLTVSDYLEMYFEHNGSGAKIVAVGENVTFMAVHLMSV